VPNEDEIRHFVVRDFAPNLLAFLLVVPNVPADDHDDLFLIASVKSLLAAVRALIRDDQVCILRLLNLQLLRQRCSRLARAFFE
jgi:hypothetical protein